MHAWYTDAVSDDAEALLARLRESTIVLDREGRFHHDGEPVTHPGVARALHRWIGIGSDGRYILQTGPIWCYFRVEDVPFLVRGVREDADGFVLSLDDETEEPLDPSTLHLGTDGVLRCRVKSGRFPARLDRHAHFVLAERLETDAAGGLHLAAGGRKWPVERRAT